MSDRIAVMHLGRVEQLGTPEELYERPASRFVADFIGTTNLLTGAIESIDGEAALVRLEGGDACRVVGHDLATGQTIELSIRPESIFMKPSNGASPDGVPPMRAQVEQVAYMGGTVQYQVRTHGGLSITVLAPKTGERHAVGSDVDIAWPPNEALVLAPATGEEETSS